MAIVTVFENIEPHEESGYQYDAYAAETAWREGLAESVAANVSAWLNAIKSMDDAAEERAIAQLAERAGGIRTDRVQSDKLGQDWIRYFCNDILCNSVYVPQDNPQGTADAPILFTADVWIITNGFYISGDVRKVWTGETSAPGTIGWDDQRWEVF